ncbi:DUF2200 domain-containing protein [Streptococcus saliviloxodontae]|uniref:DUF2200 domain-containing protein n=1 Tax=Streptococcus saliviloxodontae TaxID=1349416 RepID=A0ABS2PIP7_9STRE|nr:DUF2200 domain-containing protein [Streptococcus saliviloxodontae]MBM7635304.1 hypothetical protein [Streptococcus saliviloxodontae]
MTHRIYGMSFAGVYQALVAKAERKERAAQEVYAVTAWLTGYSPQQIEACLQSELTYGDFFRQAPAYNPKRLNITGKICGVQIETIEDSLMQEIRRLDKLVDWLAKGKSLEVIYDKYDK